MNEMLSVVGAWLTDVFVLGTALLAVTCLAFVFLRQPAARMALARGTLLGLATLCVLTALPGWPRQPLAEVLSTHAVEEEGDEALLVPVEAEAILPAPLMMDAPPAEDEVANSSAPAAPRLTLAKAIKYLPPFWLGAAGCAFTYILIGAWRAFRLLHSAVKAPAWSQLELEKLVSPKNRPPRLKTSERIATAVALLVWRPHILLAAKSVSEENKTAVRAALAHEWAHIRHGDLWLLALERLLLPVFCLHPLFWLLRRQVRIDQELLADAAAAGDAPVEYAQALLSWAKVESAVAAPRWGIAALSLWEYPSTLSRRVEMLLNSPSPAAGRTSRSWNWLAPLSLLAAVLGLSLLTLRPLAVADEIDGQSESRPNKIKKAKKEWPKKADAKRDEAVQSKTPGESAPSYQAVFQLLVGLVDHAALEKAESSLGDLIQAASEDHCRLEGNLIVADLSPQQFATLDSELKKSNALKILSVPCLAIPNGKEMSFQVGGQLPLGRLEHNFDNDPQRKLEYKDLGEKIAVRSLVKAKDPLRLALTIAAEHTELDREAELRTGDDTPRFITRKFKVEVEATDGNTLIVAEREPKKGGGKRNSILLAIVPLQVQVLPHPPVPAPAAATQAFKDWSGSSGDLARLRDENAALHKQITNLQAKLIELAVQIRWLRAAAAPGGDEKVNDQDFLRRVYLDLMGLLPTAEETKSFLNDKDPQKRDKLIDKLLEKKVYRSPDEAEQWKEAVKSQTKPGPTPSRQESSLNEPVWDRLGVKLEVMNESDFKQLSSRYRGGLRVLEVRQSGPAWQQGIRSGDVLVGLHRWETTSLENIAFVLERDDFSKDEPIEFYIIRGTDTVHGQIRLAKPKSTTSKPAPMETTQNLNSIQVFTLSHSRAEAVAQVLAKVLPQAEGLTVGVDERTNSLILRGPPDAMQKAKALLEALDHAVDPKPEVKNSDQPKTGALERQKLADVRAAEAALQAAKAQHDRIRILHNDKAVSEAELDQATVQLKHAESAVEAAKGDKDFVKLRELELQEAEAALHAAERALLAGESLLVAGKLSPEDVEALSLELRKKNAGVRHAKIRLERTRNMPRETP